MEIANLTENLFIYYLHTLIMIEAGTQEKGDALVIIESSKQREIIVESKIMAIYGESIKKTVEEETADFVAKIIVKDYGALDWVLRARLEAAIRKFTGGEEP